MSNVCTNEQNDTLLLINNYSSMNKLIHVIAYCLRFYYNTLLYKRLPSKSKLTGSLSMEEIKRARIIIIKGIQKKSFYSEIQDLNKLKNVNASSKLFRLCPFIDDGGLIRVGGRLKNAASIDV